MSAISYKLSSFELFKDRIPDPGLGDEVYHFSHKAHYSIFQGIFHIEDMYLLQIMDPDVSYDYIPMLISPRTLKTYKKTKSNGKVETVGLTLHRIPGFEYTYDGDLETLLEYDDSVLTSIMMANSQRSVVRDLVTNTPVHLLYNYILIGDPGLNYKRTINISPHSTSRKFSYHLNSRTKKNFNVLSLPKVAIESCADSYGSTHPMNIYAYNSYKSGDYSSELITVKNMNTRILVDEWLKSPFNQPLSLTSEQSK
jgi:hypothetical protein